MKNSLDVHTHLPSLFIASPGVLPITSIDLTMKVIDSDLIVNPIVYDEDFYKAFYGTNLSTYDFDYLYTNNHVWPLFNNVLNSKPPQGRSQKYHNIVLNLNKRV